MTIRDIAIAFGFDVDKASQREAENSIKGIKSLATKVLGGIAIVFSISKLSAFKDECVSAASNVQEMENKFDVVFDSLAEGVDKWAEEFADSVGRNKNTIKTYLADQQNLLVGFGMTREEGAKLSEEMTTLALDIASFSNQDEDVAVNAMTKAVMGQSEAAKTLGAVLNETTRAETMNAMGLQGTYEKLSQLEKMQVNYNTILRQSPDAIGDCVRSMGSYESSQRQLKAAQQEFKEFIGGQLLPVMAVFTQWITKGVKVATKFAKAILLDAEGNNRILKSFEKVNSIVKRLQPSIERFANAMKTGISKGIEVAKNIIDRFGGMENALKLLGIVAGAFLLVMNWSKVVSGAQQFMSVIQGIGKMFSMSSLKVLGLVAVIVILALIVEDFINFMMGNDSVIGTLFEKAGINADEVREKIFNAFEKIKTFLITAFEFIKTNALGFIEKIKEFFSVHGEEIKTIFAKIWKTVSDDFNNGIKQIVTVAKAIFGLLEAFWKAWGSTIIAFFVNTFNNLKQLFSGFSKGVEGLCQFIKGIITGDFQGAFEALLQIISGIFEMIMAVVQLMLDLISTIITIGLGVLMSIWTAMWQAICDFFIGIWNGIVSVVTSILAGITGAITGAINSIQATIQTVLEAIFEYFSTIFANVSNSVTTTFTNILSGITGTIENIKNTIVNGFNAAVDFIKGLPSQALTWGSDIIDGIVKGITGSISKVTDAVKGVAEKIKSFLHFSVPDEGPLTDYESWMPDFMGGLASGISKSKKSVIGEIKELASGMDTLMRGATASMATATNSQVNNATSNMTQNVNINNSYSGGSMETQRNVSTAMKKSAVDATTQMARGLAYARG